MSITSLEPLVSVSCLAYNHKKYIIDAIESFLMQKTDFPYEIIVNDDSSNDSTPEIISKYAHNYPDKLRTILHKQNNNSQGIKNFPTYIYPIVKGKYIAQCEGDDYWTDPYKLQKQVDFLEANPEYSMCVHNAIVHFEGGENEDHLFNPAGQKEIITTDDLIEKWSFATASIVFRRSMMDDYIQSPYLSKVCNGDLFLALMMSLKGPIKYLPEIMSVYRRHGLERYSGKEVSTLNKRVELLRIFDQESGYQHHNLIMKRISRLENSLRLQKLYSKVPLLKKVYHGIKYGRKP